MTADTKRWLLVYLIPYFGFGIISFGGGLIMLPLAAISGLYVGLTSTAPYFTNEFRIFIGAGALFSLGVFLFGYKHRSNLWGKMTNSMGFYLWCFVGLFSFGPV